MACGVACSICSRSDVACSVVDWSTAACSGMACVIATCTVTACVVACTIVAYVVVACVAACGITFGTCGLSKATIMSIFRQFLQIICSIKKTKKL